MFMMVSIVKRMNAKKAKALKPVCGGQLAPADRPVSVRSVLFGNIQNSISSVTVTL